MHFFLAEIIHSIMYLHGYLDKRFRLAERFVPVAV